MALHLGGTHCGCPWDWYLEFCAAATSRGSSKTCTHRQAQFSHKSVSHFTFLADDAGQCHCDLGAGLAWSHQRCRPRCLQVAWGYLSSGSHRARIPMPLWIARPKTSGKERTCVWLIYTVRFTDHGVSQQLWKHDGGYLFYGICCSALLRRAAVHYMRSSTTCGS